MCNSCCITAVLMQLVAHYHNKTDGLLCKLTGPCERSGFRKKTRGNTFGFLEVKAGYQLDSSAGVFVCVL